MNPAANKPIPKISTKADIMLKKSNVGFGISANKSPYINSGPKNDDIIALYKK